MVIVLVRFGLFVFVKSGPEKKPTELMYERQKIFNHNCILYHLRSIYTSIKRRQFGNFFYTFASGIRGSDTRIQGRCRFDLGDRDLWKQRLKRRPRFYEKDNLANHLNKVNRRLPGHHRVLEKCPVGLNPYFQSPGATCPRMINLPLPFGSRT